VFCCGLVTATSDRVDLGDVDLTDPEVFRDGFPHEIFTLLREDAPVWCHPATPGTARLGGEFWVVSKHADVQAVSRDYTRFRSYDGPMVQDMPPERQGTQIVTMDPPAHTRLRRLISSGFTPRMISNLDAQARAWAGRIVDHALEQRDCDFVREVAYQLPMHLIADIMGIPVSDRAWLFDRVNLFIRSLDPRTALPEAERTALELEVFQYAHDLGVEKRRCPVDDVWTTLTAAEVDTDDGGRTRLSELELDLFFFVLATAGSETVREAITAGLIVLLDHPEQLERMRREPEVMPTAVEEILRWASPADYFRRTATENVEIHGVAIAPGERVTLWYPSANRDADVFPEPFRFDIGRPKNPHVTFGGGGVHYCMGANLAKREIQVMYEELLRRVGDIEILGEPVYAVAGIDSAVASAIAQLPVRLTAR
jgi:cytochrome P450